MVGAFRLARRKSMEWKQAFDRIMDQLYNHPEEMRCRLLGKYNMPANNVSGAVESRTAIEMLQSLQKA